MQLFLKSIFFILIKLILCRQKEIETHIKDKDAWDTFLTDSIDNVKSCTLLMKAFTGIDAIEEDFLKRIFEFKKNGIYVPNQNPNSHNYDLKMPALCLKDGDDQLKQWNGRIGNHLHNNLGIFIF